MKKKISALLCIVLALTMILSLSACGSSGDKAKLVGSWQCEKDLAQLINDQFAADEATAGLLNVDEFKLVIYMEFKDDDTYSMYVDEASIDAAMDNLVTCIVNGISQYMEDLVKEQTGYEMTIDEILEANGITMDDLVGALFTSEDLEALKDEIVGGMEQEGKYKAEEGKLYTSAGLEYEVDPTMYENYTLEGKTLTLLSFVGEGVGVDETIYPMVFNKIG